MTRARADRGLQVAGFIALLGIGWVLIFGTPHDSGQDQRATRIACSSAVWNGQTLAYFDKAARRTKQRIGTPDELPTDRAGLAAVQLLLDAGIQYAIDLGRDCGRVIPLPKEN